MKKASLIICAAISCLFASCGSAEKEAEAARTQATMDSMSMVIVKQKTIDSMNSIAAVPMGSIENTAGNPSATGASTARPRSANGGSRTTNNYSSTTTTTNNQPAPVAAKKKGWSSKAKGAVIGAGAGAATGAIVNKRNRGVGALIGGAAGAAVGLGTGAIIDHKKKENEAND
ncbi:MAG: YMGG-like glycine zipper-containing protein [Bacteroidota bacterium]